MTDEQRETLDEFRRTVNMSAAELERWLETEASQSVGQRASGKGESTGHQSGRHIVELLRTRQADYTDADFAEMRRVVGYAHRHLAQRPDGDVSETRWRYSLMNWGHDPLKDDD